MLWSRLERGAMKKLLAILLCFLFPLTAFAGENGYKIGYDGGSIPGAKAGAEMKLLLDGPNVRIMQGKNEIAVIPAATITEISYGQDVHRRVGAAIGLAVFSLGLGALLALSKSKKHFIGLTWDDGAKRADSRSRLTRTITAAFWRGSKASRVRKQSTRMR